MVSASPRRRRRHRQKWSLRLAGSLVVSGLLVPLIPILEDGVRNAQERLQTRCESKSVYRR